MPPEQIAGGPTDVRADMYAFGATVFESLFGRQLFTGRSVEEIFRRQRTETPQIPSGPLQRIILRCLRKLPAERYASIPELFSDLAAACEGAGLTLPPRLPGIDTHVREVMARARGLSALGKRQEAIEAAREWIHLTPADPAPWTQLGCLLLEAGELEEARKATERSLEIDATSSPAWNNLGVIRNRLVLRVAAVDAFHRALLYDPANTGAMLNMAAPLTALNRPGEAVQILRRATEVQPEKASSWANLASAYSLLGDRGEAKRCIGRALQLDPGNQLFVEIEGTVRATSDRRSAGALMLAGDTREAMALFLRQTKKHPRDKNAWHNLGLLYTDRKDFAAARSSFKRVNELDPQDGFAVCRLIELAAIAGDLEEAYQWCDTLAALPDGLLASIRFRARSMALCGQPLEAKRLLLDALRRHPGNGELLLCYADTAASFGATESAAEAYVAALRAFEAGGGPADRVLETQQRLDAVRRRL